MQGKKGPRTVGINRSPEEAGSCVIGNDRSAGTVPARLSARSGADHALPAARRGRIDFARRASTWARSGWPPRHSPRARMHAVPQPRFWLMAGAIQTSPSPRLNGALYPAIETHA
jgi:hypothetical protein